MTYVWLKPSSLSLSPSLYTIFALKEITSRTDKYLVSLSSKTYVFEDKMTKY